MIKNIIFDMGGVIIDFSPEKTFKKYFPNDADRKEILDVLFVENLWGAQDRGTMTAGQVAALASSMLPARYHDELCNLIINWWDEMPPLPQMCEFIKELKSKGFALYLLSNTPPEIYDRMDSIPAFKYLDGIIASCDYGVVKPEPEIYQLLFDKFSLLPEECYFIDDMQRNIDGAAAMGMKGHCYSHGDINILRRAMHDEGII